MQTSLGSIESSLVSVDLILNLLLESFLEFDDNKELVGVIL